MEGGLDRLYAHDFFEALWYHNTEEWRGRGSPPYRCHNVCGPDKYFQLKQTIYFCS